MENRKRRIPKKFWVTEEENELIEQKMEQAHTKQFGAYARKMLIDGLIVHIDHKDIKNQTAEIQKIGRNINQLIKLMHSTGNIYEEDIHEIKELMDKIWLQQRQNLLRAR